MKNTLSSSSSSLVVLLPFAINHAYAENEFITVIDLPTVPGFSDIPTPTANVNINLEALQQPTMNHASSQTTHSYS